MHSQRLSETSLLPWACWAIIQPDGKVLAARCNCMAGLGESCTHIAATCSITPDAIGKSKGYLLIMKNPGVILFMMLMSDVISVLARLSLMFQNPNTTVAGIKTKLDATVDILKKYKNKDGPRIRQTVTVSEQTGVQFGTIVDSFQATRTNLIDNIIERLGSRFADTKEGIIGACKIADFRLWPDSEHSTDFGETEVQLLTEHFKSILENAGLNPVDVEIEWDQLKQCIYTKYPDLSSLEWSCVNKSGFREEYRNILGLIDLILSIPAHSADAERGFSEMKLVKSDWRSCLRPAVLSDLLTIIFHSDDIKDYDPTTAIHLWNQSGRRVRRPAQTPYGPRKSIESDVPSDNPFLDLDPDFLDFGNDKDHEQ